MSWTFIDSDGAGANGSSTTIASPALTVAAGDLVVAAVKFEGATTTVTCSDGTSSLTQWSKGVSGTGSGEPFLDVFYILASVASGSVTYTATFGAARAFRDIVVMVYRPSAAASLDGTANVSSATSGTSATSGNLTTTGSDGVAFGAYAEYGAYITAATINSVAQDRYIMASATTTINTDAPPRTSLFARTYAAGFTGQAAATIAPSNRWVLGVIAFSIGGGGGRTTKNTRAFPLGMEIGMNWLGGM